MQGHIKHAFYAAQLFFALYPGWMRVLIETPEDVFELGESEIFGDWNAFLDLYRDYEDADVKYRTRTLTSYMTPQLGGIRRGGGGGDYKVKIALPLVSRFLAERT